MIPILALWAAALASPPAQAQAEVQAFSVLPVGERTEIVIDVEGDDVTARDYLLRAPDRLVLDLSPARNMLPRERFPGIERGGVESVRTSQYTAESVRLVFDLSQPVDYSVQQSNGSVRISFPNPGGDFEPWFSSMIVADRVPDAAAEAVPVSQQVAAPAAPVVPVVQPEPRITVTFTDTPILDVLNTFAEFTGRSIVAGQGVEGQVNAEIRNQPWDVALESILEAQGLAIRETESGILRVDEMGQLVERQTQEQLVTQPFRLRYISADSVLPAIEGLISDRGAVTVSSASNTVIVTDATSVVQRLAAIIEELDARTPQVTIAAKIIFIDRTALDDLGFVYDLKDLQSPSGGNQLNTIVEGVTDQDGDGIIEPGETTEEDVILLGGNSIAALGNANQRVPSPALRVAASLVLNSHTLIGFLEALRELSLSDIQAEPVITTMDHREAYVQVGQETPIRVIDAAAGGAGGGAFPRASVETRETGIILRVTPHVTGNQVYLQLHAERSFVTLASSDVGVVFQTQESETEVLLNDGETAVISGLTVIEKTQSRAGIPILMDLPLIGPLFRRTTERESKQDLLIMVTPHIVKPGEV